MSRDDHYAFVALGKRMAQRNGYKPEQSSDLYITDGDQIDWMYGRYRIFSFTWELYPTEHHRTSDFYPPDEKIAAAVSNNRSALLYAIDKADCPYAPIYKSKTLCGPLNDDFEINRGWTRQPGRDRHRDRRLLGHRRPGGRLDRRSQAARDDDVGSVRPRDRGGRGQGIGRQRRRRRDDHDPVGARRPARSGRRT